MANFGRRSLYFGRARPFIARRFYTLAVCRLRSFGFKRANCKTEANENWQIARHADPTPGILAEYLFKPGKRRD